MWRANSTALLIAHARKDSRGCSFASVHGTINEHCGEPFNTVLLHESRGVRAFTVNDLHINAYECCSLLEQGKLWLEPLTVATPGCREHNDGAVVTSTPCSLCSSW